MTLDLSEQQASFILDHMDQMVRRYAAEAEAASREYESWVRAYDQLHSLIYPTDNILDETLGTVEVPINTSPTAAIGGIPSGPSAEEKA